MLGAALFALIGMLIYRWWQKREKPALPPPPPRPPWEVAIEKLMTYAVGRPVEHQDMPSVRRIAHEAKAGNYRFSSLVMGVVNSAPFQMRAKHLPREEAAAAPVHGGR